MSAIQSVQPPPTNAAHAEATTAPSPAHGRRTQFPSGRLLALTVVIGLVTVGLVPVMSWVEYRRALPSPTTPSSRPTSSTLPRKWSRAGSSVPGR